MCAVPVTGERTDGRRFTCEDDASSLVLAGQMAGSYASIEVWLDGTLIGSVPGPARPGAPGHAASAPFLDTAAIRGGGDVAGPKRTRQDARLRRGR